jgi:hypothetical protein
MCIASHAARSMVRDEPGRRHVIAVAGLELDGADLVGLLAAIETGIPLDVQIRTGATPEGRRWLHGWGEALNDLALFLDDTGGLTLDRCSRNLSRLKHAGGLDLVVVGDGLSASPLGAPMILALEQLARDFEVMVVLITNIAHGPASSRHNARRARPKRLMTVPTGISSASAASL